MQHLYEVQTWPPRSAWMTQTPMVLLHTTAIGQGSEALKVMKIIIQTQLLSRGVRKLVVKLCPQFSQLLPLIHPCS